MAESTFPANLETDIAAIRTLLDRAVNLQETSTEFERGIHELERERTTTSSGLLEHASATAEDTRKQTEMAAERTALTREQTRLSTRGTELAGIRTDFSRERSDLAAQRTDMSVQRTDMASARTKLSRQRTDMAHTRTGLSERRTVLAAERNQLATKRTLLTKRQRYDERWVANLEVDNDEPRIHSHSRVRCRDAGFWDRFDRCRGRRGRARRGDGGL